MKLREIWGSHGVDYIFLDVTRCTLEEVTDVSQERTGSIFRDEDRIDWDSWQIQINVESVVRIYMRTNLVSCNSSWSQNLIETDAVDNRL
jgi:hypothetical protein